MNVTQSETEELKLLVTLGELLAYLLVFERRLSDNLLVAGNPDIKADLSEIDEAIVKLVQRISNARALTVSH